MNGCQKQRAFRLLGGFVGAIALHQTVMTHPAIAQASTDLFVAYPPLEHTTVADRIFFIGTAAPNQPVTINGQVIENRSEDGHFAPTLPLAFGENTFTLVQGDESLTLTIDRVSTSPVLPDGVSFAEGSLMPAEDIARLPGSNGEVSVSELFKVATSLSLASLRRWTSKRFRNLSAIQYSCAA